MMFDLLKSTYTNKRVLVIGHTGFKGSWLTLYLNLLGAKVYGFSDSIPTQPSNFAACNISTLLAEDQRGDICELAPFKAYIETTRPDFIFHLAAQSLVLESYKNPFSTFNTNIMGTTHLLESLYQLKRPCTVVVVTSDKCYKNESKHTSYQEDDPMGGYDPYSASKGCAELIVASYQQSFFPVDALEQHKIKIATARAGNVIGGGDWAKDRIVCDIIRNIIQKKSIGLRNPSAIRPWQHVLEPLNAYLLLAAKMSESYDPVYCSPWNFGPRSADEVSVANLVSLMYKQWKQDYVWQEEKSLTAPKESQILRLYTHKASKQLNWKPKWNLEKAIEKTVTWYQRYYTQSQQNMLNISFEQIEEHMHARD